MNVIFGILLASIVTFHSPINYPISLAGNFGEPRINHFHGGIDIKTSGVEGKPIFSIGDGYISKVSVGEKGLGLALYIHHPEGYTSIYCHLKKFAPQIEALVLKWQYSHKRYKGIMAFCPTDFPVARGQLIAVSGNSGASEAPHLHLEIRETKTWNLYDPLDFIGHEVKDALPPQAHGIMAFPMKGEGSFMGGIEKQSFGLSSHNLTTKFYAWGKVGFGIWANDYMEITYNRYGVKKTELIVDKDTVFKSNITYIPLVDNMQVNAWGDYEHFLRYHVWYLRSFIQPGVTLPCLKADKNNGIVDFNQERDYHLTYVLSDFKGNKSEYKFTVKGKPMLIKQIYQQPVYKNILYYNRVNNYQLPGLQLITPPFYLSDDLELQPHVEYREGNLSNVYQLMPTSHPLFNYATLSLKLRHSVKDPSKLYIVSSFGIKKYMGGVFHDGWVTAKARELGASYEIAYDDEAPQLRPIKLSKVITMEMNDWGSGIYRYEGYLDGHFILFEEVPHSSLVRCDLDKAPIKKTGKNRQLKFVAFDYRNNKREFLAQIKY